MFERPCYHSSLADTLDCRDDLHVALLRQTAKVRDLSAEAEERAQNMLRLADLLHDGDDLNEKTLLQLKLFEKKLAEDEKAFKREKAQLKSMQAEAKELAALVQSLLEQRVLEIGIYLMNGEP